MMLLFPPPRESVQNEATPPRPRRGATAVEYLFMISLILVVCLITINHLGTMARDLFSDNAEKTEAVLSK